ncbi:MAG: hypothetical protein KC636_11130 [Myxococcales bacterium]|nr:hypothetical protein [Myxococcales bacterium]
MSRTTIIPAAALAAGLISLIPTSAEAASIVRPMYLNPNTNLAAWQEVADTCASGTPVTVVLNAHNGPGFSGDNLPDVAYEDAVRLLDESGCTLLGYVATGGNSPAARIDPTHTKYEQECFGVNDCIWDIYDEMNRWANEWAVDGQPRLDGFFFDEVNASSANQAFYQVLAALARYYVNGPAMADHLVMLNAGGPASWFGGDNRAYVDIADSYVVLEQTGEVYKGFDIPVDLEDYAPEKLVVLAHSTPANDIAELVGKAEAEELGGLMITSDAWHQSDTHWAAFAEAMAPKCTAEAFIDYCVNPGPYAWQGQCLGITTIIPDFCIVVDPSHACYYEYAQCHEVPFASF